ncbi:MAG: hypothetical protein JWQ21_632 [Herminiimonas sp.]|nr:hypothetical protein [Herminiimonas sp.]
MAVYVDDVRIAWRQNRWCHLVADSLEELHAFASKLGLKREWFQTHASYPHYDVTLRSRDQALAMGAHLGTRAVIIGCAKALRLQLENDTVDVRAAQLSLF